MSAPQVVATVDGRLRWNEAEAKRLTLAAIDSIIATDELDGLHPKLGVIVAALRDAADADCAWSTAYLVWLFGLLTAEGVQDTHRTLRDLELRQGATDAELRFLTFVEKVAPDLRAGRGVRNGSRKGVETKRAALADRDAKIDKAMRHIHRMQPDMGWTDAANEVGKACGLTGRQVRRRTTVKW